jgi:uncharacterized protein YcbX
MPTLRRLTLYPIKSLDGLDVPEARVLPSGALAWDRRFALLDEAGLVMNVKRTARLHSIRAEYDLGRALVRLRRSGSSHPAEFHLHRDRPALAAWLTDALDLGLSLRLLEDPQRGLPDDLESPGPTVIGLGSLRAVAGWFPGIDDEEAHRRFRANLLLDTPEPFWEDRLFARSGQAVRFRVGEVEFLGINPCQRCGVPTRSSRAGEPWRGFQKTFSEARRGTFPPWADAGRFDHYYRLAINTRAAVPAGGTLRVGDPVEIVETLDLAPQRP